jgi:hypothetical protein
VATEQRKHDGITVAIHTCHDLFPARMVGTAYAQIMAVERFVNHTDILTLREAIHQGC